MKILPVNSPKFGYNAEYHEQVKKELLNAKRNKPFAKTLLDADEFSLRLEDEILAMEKDSKKLASPMFSNLTGFLSDIKQSISCYMTLYFPKLKYPETLIFDYMEDASLHDKQQATWRANIANSLMGFTKIIEPPKEKKPETSATSHVTKEEAMRTLDEIGKTAVDNYKDKVAKELLEEYVPNESSPKGFCDVIGIDDVKLQLKENIVDYVKNPNQAQEDFEEYGISAPRGFLFYGPPGCGKTFITKALAVESGLDMYKLDVSKAGSKYVNQTSKNLQNAFDTLKDKALKDGKPVLLFMDEVDSLAMSRGDVARSDENMKTVSTLLKLVEGARDNNIIVIAATNKYDLLDEAFKARFDGQIYFPLPDEDEIKNLLKNLLAKRKKGIKLSSDDAALSKLSKLLKGHSIRSITFMIDEASKTAKRRNRDDITFDDVKNAAETTELEKSKEKIYKKASKASIVGFN